MVTLSVMIEGQKGLTWQRWKRLVAAIESTDFAGLFRSDHFIHSHPPDEEMLELVVSLTYLADHTQRIHFGPLVAPISFREPVLFAHQAVALDDLSSGRLILGVGAGWLEREHTHFGYTLGDVPTRVARMAEGLEVITRLLQDAEPVTFEGAFFRLQKAMLHPKPQRTGGPPILIGGNSKRYILPLVARYASWWNGLFLSPSAFLERSLYLDVLLAEQGRKPTDVKRTIVNKVVYGKDRNELDQQLHWRFSQSELAEKSLDEVIETLHARGFLIGTPEIIASQIKAYATVGVDELMLRWLDLDDLDRLQSFSRDVFSQLR